MTAEVLCLVHVARPVKGSKNMCEIAIISQVLLLTRASFASLFTLFLLG